MPRPTCYRCRKPRALCVCHDVPRLNNRTGVHLLQHMRERGHPLGTARLAKLGLGAPVHVLFSELPDGSSPPVDLPDGAVLLYPSADAVPLCAQDPPPHLVVLDGTWAQAHQLHRDNAWIQALPHARLSPTAPSRYRIRREPRADYVSTLEALVEALAVVEPDLAGLDELLCAFDRMIDAHLHHRGREAKRPRYKRPRQGRSRTIPWGLLDHPEDCVLVHVEPGPPQVQRSLLHLAAVRGGHQILDALIEGSGAHPRLCELAGLPASSTPVISEEAALEALSRLTAGASAVFAWKPNHLTWLRAHGVDVRGWHTLSAVWSNRYGHGLPEALEAPSTPRIRGRAGLRLAAGQALLEQLRTEADG